MAEEQAAHHLLNVLEERGLDAELDLDSILLAFLDDETKTEAAAWVNEYLNEETLLTKEELEFYQSLEKKGVLHQFEASSGPIRPILDCELATAVNSLQSSTTAIEAQCKVLEAQKEALMQLKALETPNLDFEHLRNERRRKEQQEKARLDVTIEDMTTAIKEQLADAQSEVHSNKADLKSFLAERLASDDHILARLPGIVTQVVTEPPVSDDEKSIEQWCKAIVQYRSTEIKAKVDTVYIRSLSNDLSLNVQNETEVELNKQKSEVQAELEDLHSEIASVAEMVVEHELRNPIMEMNQRRTRNTRQARAAWLEYVLSTLTYMSRRLNTVNEHAKGVDDFQQALTHICEAVAKRIPDVPTETSTVASQRRASGFFAALPPAFRLKPHRSLNLPPVIQDALRHANIPVNYDSVESLLRTLDQTQINRNNKLHDHYERSLSSTQDTVAERLGKADSARNTILSRLYSHTPFPEVRLTDAKLDAELRKMEDKLNKADEQILSAETSALSLSDAKVRAFLAKHGE